MSLINCVNCIDAFFYCCELFEGHMKISYISIMVFLVNICMSYMSPSLNKDFIIIIIIIIIVVLHMTDDRLIHQDVGLVL